MPTLSSKKAVRSQAKLVELQKSGSLIGLEGLPKKIYHSPQTIHLRTKSSMKSPPFLKLSMTKEPTSVASNSTCLMALLLKRQEVLVWTRTLILAAMILAKSSVKSTVMKIALVELPSMIEMTTLS